MTRNAMQSLPVSENNNPSPVPWRTLAIFFLFGSVLGAICFIRPFPPAFSDYFYAACAVIYILIAAIWCFKGSFSRNAQFRSAIARRPSWRRFSPVLLGIGLLGLALSQLALALHVFIVGQEAIFPSFPYYIIFSAYPFFACAILMLPEGNISLLARLRILLDSLIIIIAAALFFYYFFLGPLLTQGDETQAEKIAGSLYPLADLVLMFCLLLVTLRSGERALRPVLLMLGLALVCMFTVQTLHISDILLDRFHWISSTNVLWLPVLVLLAGAAQTINTLPKRDGTTGYHASLPLLNAAVPFAASSLKALISPALILVLSLLILLLWINGIKEIFPGQMAVVYIGGFVILMLAVLRQLLDMYEISVLQGRLQRRNRSLRALNERLEKQATTDSLTGLPNHRALVETLGEVLEYARASGESCALIFVDIDHFKSINDSYGHLVGDAVLRQFSELLTANMRARDRVGRWGGEEFVAILPGMGFEAAVQVAERMRVALKERDFAGGIKGDLTCSFGVATYPDDATESKSLLMCADRAMYTAKRLGRDQTRVAHEPLVMVMGMSEEVPGTGEEAEMLAVVESLAATLEARDRPTSLHAHRVATLALKLALELGLSGREACIVGLGGLLHDLGKVAMPDAILFKHGKLSAAEVEYMARHPLIGAEILTPVPSLRPVAAIVRSHHEWMNGSGYPDGLCGEEIPLGARIVAVADAYDAIVSNRVYRQGRVSSEAVRELRNSVSRQFDARVVEALARLLAEVPALSVTNVA